MVKHDWSLLDYISVHVWAKTLASIFFTWGEYLSLNNYSLTHGCSTPLGAASSMYWIKLENHVSLKSSLNKKYSSKEDKTFSSSSHEAV
jgi:hypothetical protein